MKERPIIFSAPMVRAILAGTKTQTRWVCKPQPIADARFVGGHHLPATKRNPGQEISVEAPYVHIACPYGQRGDRLWVRETWRIGSWDDGCGFWIDYCDGPRKERLECPDVDFAYRLIEQTGEDLRKCNFQPTNGTMYEWAPGQSPLRWRPSIHMPRWASRITLEVTGVRVERLQDISEADAIAEGCRPIRPEIVLDGLVTRTGRSAVDEYRQLWQSIHGPESWAANPWVWAIEFKRV
ncbi:MAG: hypothetical protein ACK40S_07290 [Burkholderiaceae bacterium]